MRQDIEEFRMARRIPYFLHFTRAENLPNIVRVGLMPRSEIDNGNCVGISNDQLRLDGRRNFNCLSAAFPNAPMFYRFRHDNPGVDWVILAIHPVVVSRRKTLFCWQNAASNEISCSDEEELSSLAAFRALYEEREGLASRADQSLQDCDPTHVQAEFLVEGIIPPAAIFCVIFPDIPCQRQYAAHVEGKQSIVSGKRGFYGTREYYRKWGDGKDG